MYIIEDWQKKPKDQKNEAEKKTPVKKQKSRKETENEVEKETEKTE